MSDDKRRGAAFHEAGHAVMALAYGAEVDAVSLTGSRWDAGVFVGKTVSPIHVTMLVVAAGVYAEARYRNDFDAAAPGFGMESRPGSDNCQLSELALRVSHGSAKEADETIMQCTQVACQNTAQDGYWRAVEGVALALLERETLTGDEVREIVMASGGIPKPAVEIRITRSKP